MPPRLQGPSSMDGRRSRTSGAIRSSRPWAKSRSPSLSIGGTLASPSTAYIYNWNMLPVGQQLWLKELESYIAFPPLQDPESYNLVQVLATGQEAVGAKPEQMTGQAWG